MEINHNFMKRQKCILGRQVRGDEQQAWVHLEQIEVVRFEVNFRAENNRIYR